MQITLITLLASVVPKVTVNVVLLTEAASPTFKIDAAVAQLATQIGVEVHAWPSVIVQLVPVVLPCVICIALALPVTPAPVLPQELIATLDELVSAKFPSVAVTRR